MRIIIGPAPKQEMKATCVADQLQGLKGSLTVGNFRNPSKRSKFSKKPRTYPRTSSILGRIAGNRSITLLPISFSMISDDQDNSIPVKVFHFIEVNSLRKKCMIN
jgi:hypothetical protein